MGDTMAYMFRDGKIDDSRIAARVYQYAKENGIGQKLKLWDEPIMV